MLLRGLPLYRAILRQHRICLAPHLRKLGDEYVKAEFRAHRAAKSDVLASFQEEWNAYLSHLQAQKGQPLVGAYLTDDEVRRLSPEQMQQLNKMKEEAAKSATGKGGDTPSSLG
uniref:Succinate dehydrogenase assembly factor 3 n=1 Tax=Nannochloropsis gaditana (strain CCMP526) TaxID=1093141 RepID=I2CQB2_NANGC